MNVGIGDLPPATSGSCKDAAISAAEASVGFLLAGAGRYRLPALAAHAVTIGYRYISIDYDRGSGSDRFIYDVDSFGPTMKVGFSF